MANNEHSPRDESPANRKTRRNKKTRTSSGKGLAALLLFLGLLIGTLFGGLVGLFTPRTGVLEGLPGTAEPTPVPTPVPTTVTRTVEVDKPITPRDCLDALDDLTAYLDDLADSREALMRADLARVSGDEQTAAAGFAEVDRELRALILAANAQSLSSAIEDCRAQADSSVSRDPRPQRSLTEEPEPDDTEPSPSPEPSPTEPPDDDGTDDDTPSPEDDTPSPDGEEATTEAASAESPDEEDPLPVPTPQSSPDSIEGN